MNRIIFAACLVIFSNWCAAQDVFYLTADRVFDGEQMQKDWAVLVQDGKIIQAGPKSQVKQPTG